MLLKLPSIKQMEELASGGSTLSVRQEEATTKLLHQAARTRPDGGVVGLPPTGKSSLSMRQRYECQAKQVENERMRIRHILGDAEKGPWSREPSREEVQRPDVPQRSQPVQGGPPPYDAVHMPAKNGSARKQLQKGSPRGF